MFKLQTTNHSSGVVRVKPFTWSYSALKGYETCPKRHWHTSIAKDVVDESSDALVKGNQVHDALAKYLVKGIPLTQGGLVDDYLFSMMNKWGDRVKNVSQGNLFVEQKMGMTRDFLPTTFFGKDVWYRGISDVTRVMGPGALAIDWKTGKVKEDATQLALMASCILCHNPDVQKVRTEFIWLEHDSTTRLDMTREDLKLLWADVLPRVAKLEQAVKTSEFPAKPGGLCRKWCPVKQCAHWVP